MRAMTGLTRFLIVSTAVIGWLLNGTCAVLALLIYAGVQ